MSVTPSEADPLVSVARVAKIFDVTPYTVRLWCRDDKMHGVKPGGGTRWSIPTSEITRFANQMYGEKK